VKATLETDEPRTHIETIIKDIRPAVNEARHEGGDVYDNAVRDNVYRSVGKLREARPIMNVLCRDRKIQVVGALYHLDTGVVEFLPDR
jgi:carbonic anhydrase